MRGESVGDTGGGDRDTVCDGGQRCQTYRMRWELCPRHKHRLSALCEQRRQSHLLRLRGKYKANSFTSLRFFFFVLPALTISNKYRDSDNVECVAPSNDIISFRWCLIRPFYSFLCLRPSSRASQRCIAPRKAMDEDGEGVLGAMPMPMS